MQPNQMALIALLSLGLLAADSGLAASGGEVSCSKAGPQAPRDIDQAAGENAVTFPKAPAAKGMQLCNIHFHKFAEHKASGYSRKAGEGSHVGYVCRGQKPAAGTGGHHEHADGCGGIALGDTVEVHWVFTTCDVEPGPSLGSCFADDCEPLLRVEARVFYLTHGHKGELDFGKFADTASVMLPKASGAVEYLGSTTGPSYDSDEKCSGFQVTWSVGPTCSPLAKASLDHWCGENVFEEDHAHGVRRLVTPLPLLSDMKEQPELSPTGG